MSNINAEELKLRFPHPTLTVIEGKPTHANVQLLQLQVYENAASITSTLGGGGHGHLGGDWGGGEGGGGRDSQSAGGDSESGGRDSHGGSEHSKGGGEVPRPAAMIPRPGYRYLFLGLCIFFKAPSLRTGDLPEGPKKK